MFRTTALAFQNALVVSHEQVVAHSLRIENGQVASLNELPRADDLTIDLAGGAVLPGFINAHDHLAMNNFARIKFREVYSNAHAWADDIEARFDTDPAITIPRAVPLADRLFLGAIKNLLAGVTTVCHHDPWHRSLDARDFPLHLVKRFGYCHSLPRGGDIARSFRRTPRDAPWIIHLAEGTDDASTRELDQLDALGCLRDQTVLVHGVGLTRAQKQTVIERGAALVWCPSSNFFLLGKSAEISELAQAGRVALGTDSRLTGKGDLWDELRVAHSTQQVEPADLLRMITRDAARILRLNRGEITVGAEADLLILPALTDDPIGSLLKFNRADAQLVLVGGKPRYGNPSFSNVFARAGIPTATIRVDGREKLLAANIAQKLKRNSVQEAGVEFL